MPENLPDRRTQRVAALLEKARAARARLIFALDATASRQPALRTDAACQLQSEMFAEAGKLGRAEIQLVYYRGPNECSHSAWTLDANELARAISRITCEGGHTKIRESPCPCAGRARPRECRGGDLHWRRARRGSIDALRRRRQRTSPILVFISRGRRSTRGQGLQKARWTDRRRAYEHFDPGAARKLAELLRAVAAFATGGLTALADLRSDLRASCWGR